MIELKKSWTQPRQIHYHKPIYDRLTALEEQPKAEYFEKLFRDLAKRITALEAKVKEHINSHIVLPQEFVDPPPTCGNCKKAARWDSQSTFVVCYAQTSELEFRRVDTLGCSRHDRRV